MIKKILLSLLSFAVLVVVGFLVAVARQPNDFRVERSTTISATAAEVFEQIDDFHKWEDWSPWAKLDPQAKNWFEGAESGEGAVFQWSGNNEVGEGKMTIVESRPHERIKIRLDFVKPFAGTSHSEFTLQPDESGTRLTWAMFGENDFFGRMMCLFMNMDDMMGKQFEKGLASIKSLVETQAAPAADQSEATRAEQEDAGEDAGAKP